LPINLKFYRCQDIQTLVCALHIYICVLVTMEIHTQPATNERTRSTLSSHLQKVLCHNLQEKLQQMTVGSKEKGKGERAGGTKAH